MRETIAVIIASIAALFYSKSASASILKVSAQRQPNLNRVAETDLPLEIEQDIYDTLEYFKREDFRGWADLINKDLLVKLDRFRRLLGVPVIVSPANGSIGRRLGQDSFSQHNFNQWGEVRAVDVMFSGVSMNRVLEVARQVGFHGIGLYPDWEPQKGAHLDVRTSRTASNPALWSMLKVDGRQMQFGIDRALV